MHQNTPRFVHSIDTLQSTSHPYTGITICYMRYEDLVVFTYSLVHKADQYSKKIGRERTLSIYNQLAKIPDFMLDAMMEFIDIKQRIGFISVEKFKEEIDSSNVFSDHLIDKLTMFDFKHSAISAVLAAFVEVHAIDEVYGE